MHTIIIIINLNACCWDFMRQTYFVLKYLFSLCHFLALYLSLFVSHSLSFSCIILYDMLWELFSLVALFHWNKHRLSHAFKHFNNCILLVYIHLNLLLEWRALSHVSRFCTFRCENFFENSIRCWANKFGASLRIPNTIAYPWI